MAAALSFRFLRGQHAQGCVRVSGREMLLSLQGLSPGACALYAIEEGRAEKLADFASTPDGSAAVTARAAEKVFLTDPQGVALWEEREDGEVNYWQAAALLRESRRPKERQMVETVPEETLPEESPSGEAEQPPPDEEQPEPAYRLREPGNEAPADDLPELRWPEEARALKPYFEAHVPFAPFDAPGWRFIRLPSPLHGVPFYAVGVRTVNDAVTQIAWAVPGSPLAAPAALPGYRYQPGRGGQGYWTMWKTVREDM